MENVVRDFISRHRLLQPDGLHLVALSGGADSVCLLLMLQRLGYRVEAMHCNFHLRGDESDRDEAFVARLCSERGVPLHLAHFDTRTYAALHRMSIEMAARDLRYAWFGQLHRDLGAETICVAHHSDDNVETVLMNFLRGTGLRGLTGIQPRRDYIVRPLLCLSRADIEVWLNRQGQTFVNDSTNATADVVRNKLRLDIIPRLKEVFPQATANILTTAHFAGEALSVYDSTVRQRLDSLLTSLPSPTGEDVWGLSVSKLLEEPSPESLLFEWLGPKGFSSRTVVQISQALSCLSSGREWSSATHTLVSHSGRLLLYATEERRGSLNIPEPGTYVYDDHTKLRVSIVEGRHIEHGNALVCCADAATVAFPLELRFVRRGDRFHPLGMRGSKLVSDFLTDLHRSVIDKRRQLVLCDAQGNIVWLAGLRMDDRYKVTENTAKTLTISLAMEPTPSVSLEGQEKKGEKFCHFTK